MAPRRFNLLLAEEGEVILEDLAASVALLLPPDPPCDGVQGRLLVGSRALYFEPTEESLPICKYALRDAPGRPAPGTALPPSVVEGCGWLVADGGALREGLVLQVGSVVEMKADGVIGPYKSRVLFSKRDDGGTPPASPERVATAADKGRSMFGFRVGAAPPPPVAHPATPPPPSGDHHPARPSLLIRLHHTAGTSLLPLLLQLWQVAGVASRTASGYERTALATLFAERRCGPFNLSLLPNFREKPLLPVAPLSVVVERVFPLVSVPGRLLVSERAVYLQPTSINALAGGDALCCWPLRDIARVLRRRRLLRDVGLELLLEARSAGVSGTGADTLSAGLRPSHPALGGVFLSFDSPSARDHVYTIILAALRDRKGRTLGTGPVGALVRGGGGAPPPPSAEDELGDPSHASLAKLTTAWQSGAVSNYDYLMALNSAAGRTRSDFTQYPVLPWVIADYTSSSLDLTSPHTFRDLSKPVGALNPVRLANLRARAADMPTGEGADPPFLYGTHYSNAAYTLYYLVRLCPEHMLRLQSGRFDAPDRLFFDIGETWRGVTGLGSDVKELTPEWYEGDGSFLRQPDGLDLGVRQGGKRVGDVGLPPWALDPGDFVAQARAALDSPLVSAQLHHWIDLIFGYKQRGVAAKEADNVFYYLTYEGAVDVETISDPNERAAVISQIGEFGNTPSQLFTAPHPSRSGGGAPEVAPLSPVRRAPPAVATPEPFVSPARPPPSPATALAGVAAIPSSPETRRVANALLARPFLPPSLATFTYDTADWEVLSLGPSTGAAPFATDAVTSLSVTLQPAGYTPSLLLTVASKDGTCVTLAGEASPGGYTLHPETSFVPPPPPPTSTLSSLMTMLAALGGAGEPPAPLSAAVLSPDGRLLFSAGWDNVMRVWKVGTGELLAARSPPTPAAPSGPATSPALSCLALVPLPCAPHDITEAETRLLCVTGSWDGSVAGWPVAVGEGGLRVAASPVLGMSEGPQITALAGWRGEGTLPGGLHALVAVGDATGALAVCGVGVNSDRPGMGGGAVRSQSPFSVELPLLCRSAALASDGARGDMLSGGVSGVTGLTWLAGAGRPSLVAATTDGRLGVCHLAPEGSPTTYVLHHTRTIVTGEVVRCLAVAPRMPSGECVVATGGNGGCIRFWRVGAHAPSATTTPPTVALPGDARLGVLPLDAPPGSHVTRVECEERGCWVTALAVGTGEGGKVVVVGGTRVGGVHAWAGSERVADV